MNRNKLIAITHMEGTAWEKAWGRFTDPENDMLEEKFLVDEEIVEEFQKLWKIN